MQEGAGAENAPGNAGPGRFRDKLWYRPGREARLQNALASKVPITLGCNIVQCVDAAQAPADIVARARAWVYLFGRADVGREVGGTDVLDSNGQQAFRFAAPSGDPERTNFIQQPGDTALQFEHSHLVVHSPAPSSFDARVILNHPGTAIATFRPASETLNVMWMSDSGALQQTFVSPWWDKASVDAYYP